MLFWPCLGFRGQVGTESVPTDRSCFLLFIRKTMRNYHINLFDTWVDEEQVRNTNESDNMCARDWRRSERVQKIARLTTKPVVIDLDVQAETSSIVLSLLFQLECCD